jgi:hypothetical protein
MNQVRETMGRDGTTESGRGIGARPALEQPVERLGSGGNWRPAAATLAIIAVLATLVWRPWGAGTAAVAPTQAASRTEPAAAGAVATAPPGAPRTSRPAPLARSRTVAYTSLVDNAWTVVALMTEDAGPSTEEPSIQHNAGGLQPDRPLLVLQQGTSYRTTPVEATAGPSLACQGPAWSRDQTAVHLPVGRVAYLGVTFPGMDPQARVSVAVEPAGSDLLRVPTVAVRLAGMIDGQLYTLPSAGPGGTILFATAPPSILASGTYRFELEIPALGGARYLYACIGS